MASRQILNNPGASLHLYDKAPRAGRKIRHITLLTNDHENLLTPIKRVEQLMANV
ncbi:MAG: hypothetical protein OEZ58_19680 [Gammaproteobacteria bacterium]|nr:hypothetical protein [Gammaproteobacteria bacterium]